MAAGILPRSMSETPASQPATMTLPIEGMTCASCVNRIDRFLHKTPGVTDATVNLATEAATIHYIPEAAGRADFVAAIEAAGYDLKPARADDETAVPGRKVDGAPRGLDRSDMDRWHRDSVTSACLSWEPLLIYSPGV